MTRDRENKSINPNRTDVDVIKKKVNKRKKSVDSRPLRQLPPVMPPKEESEDDFITDLAPRDDILPIVVPPPVLPPIVPLSVPFPVPSVVPPVDPIPPVDSLTDLNRQALVDLLTRLTDDDFGSISFDSTADPDSVVELVPDLVQDPILDLTDVDEREEKFDDLNVLIQNRQRRRDFERQNEEACKTSNHR
jgi:hypothetical protein